MADPGYAEVWKQHQARMHDQQLAAAEQKVALSMRAVQDREERAAIQRVAQQSGTEKATLGDLLSKDALAQLRRGGRQDR